MHHFFALSRHRQFIDCDTMSFVFQSPVNQNILYTLSTENAIHRILLDCVSAHMGLNESLACDVDHKMPLVGIALTQSWPSVDDDEQRLIGILENQTFTEIQLMDGYVIKLILLSHHWCILSCFWQNDTAYGCQCATS